MAKQTFTLSRDVRVRGKHCAADSKIQLDPGAPADAALIGHLLGSTALTQEDQERLLTTPSATAVSMPKPEPTPVAAAPKA